MASSANNEKSNDKVFITGIWEEKSAGGMRYFSGHLSHTCKVLIFKNSYKQKQTDPDWKMYFVNDDPRPKATPQVEPQLEYDMDEEFYN